MKNAPAPGAALKRALARLAAGAGPLLPNADQSAFAAYPRGDRRRRPIVKLAARDAEMLLAEGALVRRARDGALELSAAGAARAKREGAAPEEAFATQHRAIVVRTIVSADGAMRTLRGFERGDGLRRLAQLRNADGAPWLSQAEIRAAQRLRADWEAGQVGLVRGADWSAAPRSKSPRGGGSPQEAAAAFACDARARMREALAALAPQLRRVVEHACLAEEGVEALERAESWPARSGKIALKLGLAQLAQFYS